MHTKPTKSDGLTWLVASRNERAITHAGRHFYARRCRPGTPLQITEHDRCIATHGSAKPLRVWTNRYQVDELSQAVREICGEAPELRVCRACYSVNLSSATTCDTCSTPLGEPHPSVSWDEHMAAMSRRTAPVTAPSANDIDF